MSNLKGKVALVTGSTSGIGLGVAKSLAEQGVNIALNGFGDIKEIEAIRKDIESKHNVKTIYLAHDLSKSDQVVKMIEDAEKNLGQVDILINNAGIQHVAPIEEFPIEKWDAVIAINLSAAFHAIRKVIPGMKKRDWGRIINIASAHGLVASKNKAAYVAAKHGILGLTKVVGLENATSNITCNAICPGWVLTPLVQKQIDDRAKAENISVKQAEINLLSEKQPSLKFTLPEEIGALSVYLCGEAASNITGTALSVDGGWTAQ